MFEHVDFGKENSKHFLIRVFDLNACWYLNKSLKQSHVINGNKKDMQSTTSRPWHIYVIGFLFLRKNG